MLDKGLYFHSDGGLEDAFDFFGKLYLFVASTEYRILGIVT